MKNENFATSGLSFAEILTGGLTSGSLTTSDLTDSWQYYTYPCPNYCPCPNCWSITHFETNVDPEYKVFHWRSKIIIYCFRNDGIEFAIVSNGSEELNFKWTDSLEKLLKFLK